MTGDKGNTNEQYLLLIVKMEWHEPTYSFYRFNVTLKMTQDGHELRYALEDKYTGRNTTFSTCKEAYLWAKAVELLNDEEEQEFYNNSILKASIDKDIETYKNTEGLKKW